MKTIEDLKNRKTPFVILDPSLDHFEDKVLFPKKLQKAMKILNNSKLPKNKNSL